MIGFYNYTVILTYMAVMSAVVGITQLFKGRLLWAIVCLMLAGCCDMFDGKVASMCKRTKEEKEFGIQIDSLSDVIAFGVLPACIGAALFRRSEMLNRLCTTADGKSSFLYIFLHAVLVLYILAALIRLAYFNVTEEMRQEVEGDKARSEYTGLPVTSAALILPVVMIIDFLCRSVDLGLIYFAVIILMSLAFLLKFKIRKLGLKGVLFLIGIGVIEGLLLVLCLLSVKRIIFSPFTRW